MSLKAKLEAVIYAAEEPVTLSQLAALFSADALEWKAQQEAAAAEQTAEVAAGESSVDSLPLLQEGLENIGLVPDEPEQADMAMDDGEAAVADLAVPDVPETAAAGEPQTAAEPEAAADPEAEARKEARAREREIKGILKQILDELVAEYDRDSRGLEIREIAGGYRMATKPEVHDAVRLFVKSLKPPLKLSLPALETLAVVAYKQPVTAPEVSEIRGVETGGVLGSLLARKLIATAGRKQVIGRPILYKTTKEFLLRFGLKDLSELPSMEEFEKMAAADIDAMEPDVDAAEAAEAAEAIRAAEAAEPGAEDIREFTAGAEAQAPVPEEVAAAMASEDQLTGNAETETVLQHNSPSGTELAQAAEVAGEQPSAEDEPPAEHESASESQADAEPGDDQDQSPEAAATAAVEEASPADGEPTAAEIEASTHAKEEEER